MSEKRVSKINIFICWFLLVFVTSFSIYMLNASDKVPKVGEEAPNILLKDLKGEFFNLKKLKYDGFILVSFSATFCKPCKEEIKEFMKLQKEIGEKKLKIYLIFVDQSSKIIKAYVKKNKVTLSILHDKYKIVYQKYRIAALPTSFLLNKKGVIVYQAVGFNEAHLKKMKKLIR